MVAPDGYGHMFEHKGVWKGLRADTTEPELACSMECPVAVEHGELWLMWGSIAEMGPYPLIPPGQWRLRFTSRCRRHCLHSICSCRSLPICRWGSADLSSGCSTGIGIS